MSATSQAVPVVPMFAPKTSASPCGKVSRPALTRPMVVIVVALDDCTSSVTRAPQNVPLTGVAAAMLSTVRSAEPASAFRPSVMMAIPIKNRPTPPRIEIVVDVSPCSDRPQRQAAPIIAQLKPLALFGWIARSLWVTQRVIPSPLKLASLMLASPFREPDGRPKVFRRRKAGSRRLILARRREQMPPVGSRPHLVARCCVHEVSILPDLPAATKRAVDRSRAERYVTARGGELLSA